MRQPLGRLRYHRAPACRVASAALTRPTSQAAHLQGLARALSGAVLFSGKAVAAKLLYREGIDAVTLIALRMLLSLPFFVAIALYTWKRAPNLDRRTLVFIALLGVLGYYVSSMLDFLGLQYVSAGLERLILFSCPSFVLLLGLVAFGRSVLPLQWLSLLLAYAGIGLVVRHAFSAPFSSCASGVSCQALVPRRPREVAAGRTAAERIHHRCPRASRSRRCHLET